MWRHATESALTERAALVRTAAGERFDELELNIFVGDAGVIGDRQPRSASLRALVKAAGLAVLGGSPYLLYGTLNQLRDAMLRRRVRTGVSSYGIPARAMESFAPLVSSLIDR